MLFAGIVQWPRIEVSKTFDTGSNPVTGTNEGIWTMTVHMSVSALCCLVHGKVGNALSRKGEVQLILGLSNCSTTDNICGKYNFDEPSIYNFNLNNDLEISKPNVKVTCNNCIQILKKNGF